jgi:tyrosine-protein kinase Etk/Wzc
MNPPSTTAGPRTHDASGDEFNLLAPLDIVLNHWGLIAAVTLVAVLLGAGYALFATPIYQANTLVQVEDRQGLPGDGPLADVSNLFEIRSPATAEMQILRSRLVVGQTVDHLHLDLDVRPKYLPVIGRWLARRAKAPSQPGIGGWGGYVSGNEALDVSAFEVPDALAGKPFRLRLTAQGYALLSPDDDLVGEGRIGEPLSYAVDGEPGRLLVTRAVGKPGAEFYLTRFFALTATEALQKKLNIVEQGKQSGVISASLEGSDPRRIAQVLNEIGANYVRQNVERKSAEAQKSLSFLGTFLPQLRQQLEESESKYNAFRHRNSTFDLGTEGKAVLERTVKLQENLLELQQKRKELRSLYGPEHFSIRTIDAQIASVNEELARMNGRVKNLPDLEQDLLRLIRDVKVNNDLYVNLLNSAQQLRLVKEGKVGNVRIVDAAAPPKAPVKPPRMLVLALSAALGLFVGLALALVRDGLRPGLKDPMEIEQRTGLHVFATVPHSSSQVYQARSIGSRRPGSHVLALTHPGDAAVESLRSLRTALQFAMLDAVNNVILITGPTPGLGKSFACVNLAAVLGAAHKKILLVDADLRRGHMNQYFGLARDRGLSEVVSGSIRIEEALHREVAPNVDFLSSGILPPNPAELLTSAAAQALVRRVSAHYDLVLIDSPPVLAASDAGILAPLAGAVFLVARADHSTLGELNEAAKRLRDAGVQAKGVIFNDLNPRRRRYGYGLGRKYAAYRYADYGY